MRGLENQTRTVTGGTLLLGLFLICIAVGWGSARGDSQIIQTLAGTGIAGFSGDGGAAVSAQLNTMQGLAVDADGNLYIAEPTNQVVRRVDTDGVITTIAGIPGQTAFNGDGIPATQANLATPSDVVIDRNGNLYVADNGHHRIRRIDQNGIISTVAGTGEAGFSGDAGPATAAQLNLPSTVALDGNGNLYIGEARNLRIRRVDVATGIISTVAGTGGFGFSGDGGSALMASFKSLSDLTVGPSGEIYVADTLNNRVRRISTDGVITTVAGVGTFLVNSDADLKDDGPATEAVVRWPFGITFDDAGNLYIAENASNRVRRVDTNGVITTVAGSGDPRVAGFGGDGGPACDAQMNGPSGVVVDSVGNMYISDARNYRVRTVNAE